MDAEQSLAQGQQGYAVENNQLVSPAQKRFYASEVCVEARERLQALVRNPDYNTDPPHAKGNPLPFVDRHLHHLSMHPGINLDGYISNLKLMTSIKHRS